MIFEIFYVPDTFHLLMLKTKKDLVRPLRYFSQIFIGIMGRGGLLLIIFLFVAGIASGQSAITRGDYIEKYAQLAMQEMARTGIPASITLAQACLESDNGNSRLARDAKNHFGIKCHDWTGRKIYHDDDENDECFRKYKSEVESFIDHSEFLTSKSRYEELFQLKPDDYKAWARGLKRAGYATNSKYADLLIKIIEDNELYRYDQNVIAGTFDPGNYVPVMPETDYTRQILTNNRIECVISEAGDTPESLRAELDLYPFEIYRYNELKRGEVLDSGMIIYIQPKRWKAEHGIEMHKVAEGETMADISQLYGVRLNRLYRMNNIPIGSSLEAGTIVWLRKSKPDIYDPDQDRKTIQEEKQNTKNEMKFQMEDI